MYCNFEYTGQQFNNKKVYTCKECGITLGLDSSDIKVLCFKQQRQLADMTYNQLTGQTAKNEDIPGGLDLAKYAENELIAKSMAAKAVEEEDNKQENLCSQEEINSRLTICNSCEHFKENACMLCGCKIVREANYQNKLAHRNASCPINKWGPIKSRQ